MLAPLPPRQFILSMLFLFSLSLLFPASFFVFSLTVVNKFILTSILALVHPFLFPTLLAGCSFTHSHFPLFPESPAFLLLI